MTWQPIETAPKADEDGPECIEIFAYWPGGIMEVVYWARGGWFPANFNNEDPWSGPTHWMHLPAPPAEDK